MEKIPELNQSHVHIRNRDQVWNKIQKMTEAGHTKLQVCTAFDFTITNGSPCSYGILEEGGLPDEYNKKAGALRNKYVPVELDPNLTNEQKIPALIEWFTQAHALLQQYGISKKLLQDIVRKSTVKLRDGFNTLCSTLNRRNVPMLIFSAGIGDVIREVLSQKSVMYDNMNVVSNDIRFNDEGEMTGFSYTKLIHGLNKGEIIKDSGYYDKYRERTNVLLVGDYLGDLEMSAGVNDVNVQLAVGFLNFRIEDSLELYKSQFDIVICANGTMDVVNAILNEVLVG